MEYERKQILVTIPVTEEHKAYLEKKAADGRFHCCFQYVPGSQAGEELIEGADAIIDWAQSHDTAVRGHCLVWYKSLPAWVLADGTTKEEAFARIDRHVAETMEYFGSDVYCWDVVNEALKDTVTAADLERGTIWRTGDISGAETGDWYALCGTDYITQAFRSAAAAREEYGLDGVELFYNDYKLNDPAKREACVQVV